MKRFAPRVWLSALGWCAGVVACSASDLVAISRGPGAARGGDGGAGNAGTSGAATGGVSVGSGEGGDAGGDERGGEGGGAGAPSDCTLPGLTPGDVERSVVVDGVTRSYLLHVPAAYDGTTRVPLVLDFHPVGASGSAQRASSPYPAALDPRGVIMAFPDGMSGPAGPGWNVGPCCVADVDDVAFARAVVADIARTACIELDRVYAIGTLMGGGMAHYLGCHAADVFAAVAPSAFDLLQENVDECRPSRPISVISFRGMGVSRVPYRGGSSSLVPGMPLTFLGAEETFSKWAALDGCVGPASPRDGNGCSAYSGCRDGAEVVLCTEPGAGEEPGDPAIAWAVLERHSL